MPSFWTSDAPLGQFPVRIQPGMRPHSRERRLAVPPATYAALQASLARRQTVGGGPDIYLAAGSNIYAAVAAQDTGRRPCVVLVVKAEPQFADDSQDLCTAGDSVWEAIGGQVADQDYTGSLITATIEPVAPVLLTEIVLGVPKDKYAGALAAQDTIAQQLEEHSGIYYPGLVTSISGQADPISLECLMCQPVSQGIISKNRAPRIVIVKGTSAQPDQIQLGDAVDEGSSEASTDFSSWDLDAEWFILGSSAPGDERGRLASAVSTHKRPIELTAAPLNQLPDPSELVPEACPGEDVTNRGFMSLESLARAGIVSGSWALVGPALPRTPQATKGTPNSQQRAIRIFGWDQGPGEADSLMLPPLLLYNMLCSGPQASLPTEYRVAVTPLGSPPAPCPSYIKSISGPTGSSESVHQPPLPIAKRVVIARISSPLSERRDLETASLAALREWLSPSGTSSSTSKPLRVVASGDLIAVRISLADATVRSSVALVAGADAASRARGGEPVADPSDIDVDPVADIALDHAVVRDGSACGSVGSNLVFYRVVRAEGFSDRQGAYGLQAVPSLYDISDSSDVESIDSDMEDADEYELADDGDSSADPLDREWAAWHHQVRGKGLLIEPEVTMVTQAGSEHSLVPYLSVGAYMSPAALATKDVPEPYGNVFRQLSRLARAALHPLALSRNLICAALLKGNPGTGKRHLVHRVAGQLGVHLYELNCFDVLSDTEDKTAQVLQMYFQNARRYTPCILHLRAVDALVQASNTQSGQETPDDLPIARVLKACVASAAQAHRDTGHPLIVIATSSQPDKVPASLATAFRHEIELPVPDEQTRLALLQSISANSMPLASDTDLAFISQQTASFVARDLVMLIKRAESRAWKRAHPHMSSDAGTEPPPQHSRDVILAGQEITSDDLLGALGDARASMSDTLGVPKIPDVKWDDVGGLADAKKDILDTIRLPMEQPHLFASGLSTRSGLLFYGPPGTGKTLLAKAIATECGLNFFSCKGPELISPYIGESEANVRRIFQKAREASPCVIFFDELDSLAPKRGQQGDSGGVMDRIVSQLLAELDGMSGGGDGSGDDDDGAESADAQGGGAGTSAIQVFAIGATNRPDLLDPALLRPGRFDKLVYLGVSETHDAQLNIIQALTRKFRLHPGLDLRTVADKCPFHYTGADFYALCSDALLKAMLRTVDEVDVLVSEWNQTHGKDSATAAEAEAEEPHSRYPVPMTPQYYLDHIAPEDIKQVTVTEHDFERALDELIPSVSADELVRYQVLRRQFDTTQKKDSEKSAPSEPVISEHHVQSQAEPDAHVQQAPRFRGDRSSQAGSSVIASSASDAGPRAGTKSSKARGKEPAR
ncbi:peroxisomal assembly protein [Coemansia sp. RSA 552]|nr:peroxisomal assembly protein [Coemansia sp. RSA 552]